MSKIKSVSQQSFFYRLLLRSKNATSASLKLSYLLAKKKTFLQDGKLLKSAFHTSAGCLFESYSNKLEIMLSVQSYSCHITQLQDNASHFEGHVSSFKKKLGNM